MWRPVPVSFEIFTRSRFFHLSLNQAFLFQSCPHDPADSLSRLGNPEEPRLSMIGMVFSKVGTKTKFAMIGTAIPKYNSIHNKRFHKQLLSGAREMGTLVVDPVEVAEI
jgi:hypothetical protein